MTEQNTPEWLEMRKSHVGASDAPIIMKVSPWKTPYQLWQEKMSLAESQTNFAMEKGHDMEPKARAALEDKLGMPLGSKVRLSSKRSWMMASSDAMSFDERIIAEIKCPGKADHEAALSGQVPEKYYPQLQHQIEVCGVDMAFYFSFYVEDGALLTVHRDDEYIKRMLIEEEKFYECMQNFESPDLLDRDYVYHSDARWSQLAERLKEIKALQAEEEKIKKELIEIAGGQNSMGGGIRLSKCMRKGSVDYSKIPQIQEIDLEPYRKKSTTYWRIS